MNVKLSNSQLNKLKSAIKNENNFSHKLLLTNTQVSKIRKTFPNGSSANVKFSKTELHKIGHSREFLGRLLGPLLKRQDRIAFNRKST